MKNYVRFEIIEKNFLNDYLKVGWQIILYDEAEKKYEVGLPIEKAYEQTRRLAKKFIAAGLLEELFIRTAQKYGKEFADYDYTYKNTVQNFNKTPRATHYIDFEDPTNRELNEILRLLPIMEPQVFAKLKKKDS